MVHLLLALALARAVADVPTCPQTDEATLLQGLTKVHLTSIESLQPHRASPGQSDVQADPPDMNDPDAVVAWVNANPGPAASWTSIHTGQAAQWMDDNPEAAQNIFDNQPNLEEIIFPPDKGSPQSLKLLLNTTCLDGSPAGYYSFRNHSSDIWVIYMEGGGGCASATECDGEVVDAPVPWIRGGWNRGHGPRGWRRQGIGAGHGDCGRNPHFCEANHVHIPYCTGDKHQGQREQPHDGPRYHNRNPLAIQNNPGFYTSGHLNFQAIIDDLIENESLDTASRVLLTGVSAGGVGVISNADYLKGRLEGVTVKAAPIAGWFFPDFTEDHPNETWMMVSNYNDYSQDPSVATAGIATLDIMSATEKWSNATRGNCPDTEGAKCQLSATRAAYVETPMFVSMNMWDFEQLTQLGVRSNGTANLILGNNPTTWTDAHRTWLNYYARAMRASTIHWLNQSNTIGNGLFVAGTIEHGRDIGVQLPPISAEIDGNEYFEVLADWFYDRGNLSPHVFIDACDSVEACGLV